MNSFLFRILVVLVVTAWSKEAHATDNALPTALRLPGVFGDNMVLQQDKPVRIWGWAPPGQVVTVKIGDQQKTATAGGEGKWMVLLDPLKAGGPMEMTVEGGSTITIKNILAGEVWLCSGQSNMELPMSPSILNGAAEIQSANYPEMRLFTTKVHAPAKPDEDCQGQWVECSPQTVAGFSAAAYFFGRKLHQELKVPVGLIVSAVGVLRHW